MIQRVMQKKQKHPKVRLSLTLYGVGAVVTRPLGPQEAKAREAHWVRLFGPGRNPNPKPANMEIKQV